MTVGGFARAVMLNVNLEMVWFKAIVQEISTGKESDINSALKFFETEYQLNHAIGTSKKPVISIMNGITSNLRLNLKI